MKIHIVSCDKCDTEEDLTEDLELPEEWTNIDDHGDLCPNCSNEFDKIIDEFIEGD